MDTIRHYSMLIDGERVSGWLERRAYPLLLSAAATAS
jgi:hypothetical protein